MKHVAIISSLFLASCMHVAPQLDEAAEEAAIIATLKAQDAAWNRGDIEAFMADYVPDETLRFASGNSVEYGWQPTLERYQRRYPNRAAMGKLSITDVEVDLIDANDALVFARWQLEREADRPNGLFTLHMVKRDGRWLIQSDHTSSE